MAATMAEILADLDREVYRFDLDKGGLGEKAMDIAVEVMLRDMDAEQSPDGTRWPDLSDAYAEAKAGIAPGSPMAVLHGEMKSTEQLAGERRITPHRCTMVFGTTQQARDEACWFQEGDPGGNQPPRPFWGFSVEALTRTDHLFDDTFKGP